MVDRSVLDGSPAAAAAGEKAWKKLGGKRKRSLLGEKMSSEEKETLASNYRLEVDSLLELSAMQLVKAIPLVLKK